MSKLLNCPFCGGEAEIHGEDPKRAPEQWAACKRCHASSDTRSGAASAARAWNTRASPEPGYAEKAAGEQDWADFATHDIDSLISAGWSPNSRQRIASVIRQRESERTHAMAAPGWAAGVEAAAKVCEGLAAQIDNWPSALRTSLDDSRRLGYVNAAAAIRSLRPDAGTAVVENIARPLSEWHEGMGDALWWKFPIVEPPYCGNPLDCGQTVETHTSAGLAARFQVGGWPGYHTHFTPIATPAAPEEER